MTAKLVTVCNQKGGCGKTHLAMTLGGALGARGLRVLVVDGDPQGTATRWYSAASEARPFPAAVISLAETRGQIARALKAHVEHYDVIVVDCPPSLDSPVTLSTLVVADVALVPTIPAPGDLWATSRLVGLIEQARTMNDALQVRLVPNMVQGTALASAALLALQEIPLPVARTSFGLRTAYRQAQAEGTIAVALRDPRAAEEVGGLVDEVLGMLELASAPASTARAEDGASKAAKVMKSKPKAAKRSTKAKPTTAPTGTAARKSATGSTTTGTTTGTTKNATKNATTSKKARRRQAA
jgi:chromosome partitioning protein